MAMIVSKLFFFGTRLGPALLRQDPSKMFFKFKATLSSILTKYDQVPKVYVDGSSVKTTDGYRVGGAGIYWGEGDPQNASHPLVSVMDEKGRQVEVTNNRAELTAALLAVQAARDQGLTHLMVLTDSEIVVKGMTYWIKSWMREDWKKKSGGTVLNKRLFLHLWVVCKQMDSVEWKHVRGHSGHDGNEQAHLLANEGSRKALEQVTTEGRRRHRLLITPEDDDDKLDDFSDEIDEETLKEILNSDFVER